MEHIFNLTERRKYAAFSVIAEAAKRHAKECEAVFLEGGFSYTDYLCARFDRDRKDLIQAIDAIPVHEVGSYVAVSALVGLKVGMMELDKVISSANVYIEGLASRIADDWQRYDTLDIHLCCNTVRYHSDALIDAMTIEPNPTGQA